MQDQLSKATKTVYTILRQIATLIPREFVKDTAAAHVVKWRTFDPWSHLLTLVIVQLSRQESLNGICDIAKALSDEWDKAQWDIETFFRELKQTCQIHDFIGYSESAVKWQVWADLIALNGMLLGLNYNNLILKVSP